MRFRCVYCEAITGGDRCRNCGAARYEHALADPVPSAADTGLAAFASFVAVTSTHILMSGRGVQVVETA